VYSVVLGTLAVVEVRTPVEVCVAVTGQTVVKMVITSVVTDPRCAGQLVIVGAHEVTV
jgi:hypothetical protein